MSGPRTKIMMFAQVLLLLGDVSVTEVRVEFNQDEAKFNFNIKETILMGPLRTRVCDGKCGNLGTNTPFEPSTLKTKLDDLMVTLNAVHDKDVFEYQIDGRAITFFQRWWGVKHWWICYPSLADMVATAQ